MEYTNLYKCAPSKKYENGSCIPLCLLVEMAQAYNQFYCNNPDKPPIKLSTNSELLDGDKYKKYLVREFKNRLSDICKDQQCWVRQEFVCKLNSRLKADLKYNTFRPKGPQGAFSWLNTSNIDKVMEQYHQTYPNFKFLGTIPIDFDELPVYGIKDLDFQKLLSENKYKLGIIFNLDEHWKSGSHWVGLYADIKSGEIYYFDSYGLPPEPRIIELMRRLADFIKSQKIKPKLDYNKLRHQYKSSNCGDYSMAFILRMLRGDSFHDINTTRVSDEAIGRCREYYYSK